MAEVNQIPLRYKTASEKKIKKVLAKMPPATREETRSLIVETARGKIEFCPTKEGQKQ